MAHTEIETPVAQVQGGAVVGASQRRRIGSAAIVLTSGLLLVSGTLKLLALPPVVQQLNAFGFEGMLPFLALLDWTSAVLLLVPRTRSLGLVFASAFLGGAIATHVAHHQVGPGIPAILTLGTAWLGVALRHPEALWSF